jgi:probable rRNA maturation factor
MKVLLDTEYLGIVSNVKSTPKFDRVLFTSIKDKVLGKKYELSVLFAGRTLTKRLNKERRNKNYATDILSFPLSDTAGEIIINPEKAKRKSKEFSRTFENYLVFIFIHGLFHLKGFDHGSTMESEEARVRRLFKI